MDGAQSYVQLRISVIDSINTAILEKNKEKTTEFDPFLPPTLIRYSAALRHSKVQYTVSPFQKLNQSPKGKRWSSLPLPC